MKRQEPPAPQAQVPPPLRVATPKSTQAVEGNDRLFRVAALIGMITGFVSTVGFMIGVVYLVHISSLLKKTVKTNSDIVTRVKTLEGEIRALRHLVASKAEEDIIYLKTLLVQPSIDRPLARKIARVVHAKAKQFKRDPDLILALIDYSGTRVQTSPGSPSKDDPLSIPQTPH